MCKQLEKQILKTSSSSQLSVLSIGSLDMNASPSPLSCPANSIAEESLKEVLPSPVFNETSSIFFPRMLYLGRGKKKEMNG